MTGPPPHAGTDWFISSDLRAARGGAKTSAGQFPPRFPPKEPLRPVVEGKSYFLRDFSWDEDTLYLCRGVALLGGLMVAEGVLFGIFVPNVGVSLALFLVIVVFLVLAALVTLAMRLAEIGYSLVGATVVAVVLGVIAVGYGSGPANGPALAGVALWTMVTTEVLGTAALLVGLALSMRISRGLAEEG